MGKASRTFIFLSLLSLVAAQATTPPQSTTPAPTAARATSTPTGNTTIPGNGTLTNSATGVTNGTNQTTAISSSTTAPLVQATATPTGLISVRPPAPGVTQSGIITGPNDGFIAAAGKSILDRRLWLTVGAVAVAGVGGWSII